MAIRSGTTESEQIVGSNTEKMFTTEVTELTEFDHTRIVSFASRSGRLTRWQDCEEAGRRGRGEEPILIRS